MMVSIEFLTEALGNSFLKPETVAFIELDPTALDFSCFFRLDSRYIFQKYLSVSEVNPNNSLSCLSGVLSFWAFNQRSLKNMAHTASNICLKS